MLMPIMYKMGAMMTLLTVLTVISLKGLLIGKVDGEGKNPIGRKNKKKKKRKKKPKKKKVTVSSSNVARCIHNKEISIRTFMINDVT